LDVTLTAVPEASSWAMGGVMALVGAGYFLRVRRQARRERESKSQ
jgi:MYXO-CTERM domain-containing protein